MNLQNMDIRSLRSDAGIPYFRKLFEGVLKGSQNFQGSKGNQRFQGSSIGEVEGFG